MFCRKSMQQYYCYCLSFASLFCIFSLWRVTSHWYLPGAWEFCYYLPQILSWRFQSWYAVLFLSSSKITSLHIIWSVSFSVWFVCVLRFKLCRGSQFCSCRLATIWCFWSWSVSAVSQNCCLVSWGASLCGSPGLHIVLTLLHLLK